MRRRADCLPVNQGAGFGTSQTAIVGTDCRKSDLAYKCRDEPRARSAPDPGLGAMSDEKVEPVNSSVPLIEEAKKERQRLLAQIEQSQRTIEHSRQIIARIDDVLASAEKK
jgi:hypothetical protein